MYPAKSEGSGSEKIKDPIGDCMKLRKRKNPDKQDASLSKSVHKPHPAITGDAYVDFIGGEIDKL